MPTQTEIAQHLFMSQPRVSALLRELGMDAQSVTMEEVREAYIERLRAEAAGHRGDDGESLTAERAKTERVDRELKLITLAEKKGLLVPRDAVLEKFTAMVHAAKAELMSMVDQAADEIRSVHGIEVDRDLLERHVLRSLGHLAGHGGRGGSSGPAGGEDLGTAASDGHH